MNFKTPLFVQRFAAMSISDQVLAVCMVAVSAGYLIRAVKS